MAEQGMDGQGAGAAVATPESAASTSAVPDGQGTYDMNTHILLPKADIPPVYEGRWSGVAQDANQYRRAKDGGLLDDGVTDLLEMAKASNMTPRQMYAWLQENVVGQGEGTPATGGERGAVPAGITREDLDAALAGFGRQMKTEAGQQARIEEVQAKMRDERTFVTQTLTGAKFNMTADGQPGDPIAEVAQTLLDKLLNEQVKKAIPPYVTGDERAKAIAELASTPTTKAQQAAARESFKKLWADLKNENVSDFAAQQDGIPNVSLAGGAGGPQQKDPNDMSPLEKAEHVAELILAKGGPDIRR